MRIKLKIQQKIQIFIISASIIIYAVAVGYLAFNARKMAYNDAKKATNNHSLSLAAKIQDKFDYDMAISMTLANAFQIYDEFDKDEWQSMIKKMYANVFKNNEQISGIWDSWELSAIDSTYTKDYGRIANSYWKEKGRTKSSVEYRSMNGDSDLYAKTKSTLIPTINEPYADVITGEMMTSLKAPIVKNGKYQAVIGMDITLTEIQNILNNVVTFEGSYAYMVTYQGVLASYPDADALNKPIAEVLGSEVKSNNVIGNIQNGAAFNYTKQDENGNELFVTYAPIRVKHTNTPWSIAVVVPEKIMMQEATHNFRISLLVGLLGILFMAVVIYLLGGYLAKPIVKITELLKQLSKGNVDPAMKLKMNSGDELEDMTNSANQLIDGLGKTADFARTIGTGNLNAEYQKAGENDVLGEALLEMRQSLVNAEQEEKKRKIEDEKQNWATQGLAKFGDILRQHNQSIEELSFNIMSNLVDYVDAIQGALFIKNEDEEDEENTRYELSAAIAYDRQKVMDTSFGVGEGLVGRCAYERLTIYMEEVPEDYVHVTSGLGESNPRSILLVPAVLNDEVYGIVELVSFNKFEQYQIDFVEKIGESIASTISNAKINERTQKLLNQSKQQAEELAAQEEEMRQNLEELQATQEEVARLREEDRIKNEKMLEEVESYKTTLLKILDHIPVKVFLKDGEGRMEIVNKKLLEVHKASREEIMGKSDFDFFADDYEKAKRLWDNEQALIKSGKIKKEVYEEMLGTSRGVILDSTLYPFYIDYLKQTGILGVQVDITELKNKEKEIEELKQKLADK